jgi:hypothetical protein
VNVVISRTHLTPLTKETNTTAAAAKQTLLFSFPSLFCHTLATEAAIVFADVFIY